MIESVQKSKFRRNLLLLYLFQCSSHLWFDGALWVVYWEHRGMNLLEIGILEAVLHLVSLCLDIPMGIFADRIGWKYSLMLSTLAGMGYGLFSLLPNSVLGGFMAFGMRGLQLTLASGSDMSMAYETVKRTGLEHKYQTISGRMFAVQLISLGAAEAAGGWMAAHHWSPVYYSFTAAHVLAFVCASGLVSPTQDTIHGHVKDRPSFVGILKVATSFAKQNRSYRVWIFYSSILSGLIATFSFYGQSLLHDAGWTTVGIGILTGVECGSSAIASTFSVLLARRLGAPGIGAIAALGIALFSWLPGLSKGLGYLLTQSAGSAAEPLIDQRLNHLVPTVGRATLLSANSTAFSIVMVIGFPLFGLLSSEIGTPVAYRWCSSVLLAVVVIVSIWRFYRRRNRKRRGATVGF